jgi:hypothetical protein
MPTVAYFYGISIRMYLEDHNPPHFHAIYAGNEAFVSIATGEIIEGRLPRNAARLVKEWTLARQSLLMDKLVKRAGRQAGEEGSRSRC